MSFLPILKGVSSALKTEDELGLAHLYGQKLDQMGFLKNKKSRFSGVFFRVLLFFRFLWLNASLTFTSKSTKSIDVLFFAGTDNQFNSLVSTVEGLEGKKLSSEILLGAGVGQKNRELFVDATTVKFDLATVLIALLLFLLRSPKLYFLLRKQKRRVEINQYFNVFCQTYAFLPCFIKQLSVLSPGLVVMSNDHNVPNRCLRLAAEVLGVKILYMQHASVSELFPPLEFDYALLDGRIALDTYSRCLQVANQEDERTLANVAKCQVILSGQKKPVCVPGILEKVAFGAGVAVNSLDDFEHVEALVMKFVEKNESCIVRTHPFQATIFLEKLHRFISSYPNIVWSNSREESLLDFFAKVNCVIAGNTSIHLEAALAGLPTFYYEMNDEVHLPDYYGYVKNRISKRLDQGFSLETLKSAIDYAHSAERHQAIKNYSETYDTPWQNREGELSAWVIEAILNNQPLDKMFKNEEPGVYKSVMSLSIENHPSHSIN